MTARAQRGTLSEDKLSGAKPHSEERLRRRYSFGDFTLDAQQRVLRRGGEELTLRPKSFEVLTVLLDHHGQLVTKAALMEAVWWDTAVTDNSLSQCMVEIRRALGPET
jgi:DNA-binding winged helix-turn-helix (wHTH) protein